MIRIGNQKNLKWAITISFLIICFISACSPNISTQIPKETERKPIIAMTSSPVFTPTTIIISPTPSPSPANTLTSKEAVIDLETYLQRPNECVVPCFLGIVPGVTTRSAVKDIFSHYGSILSANYVEWKSIENANIEFENGLSISSNVFFHDEIVESIRLRLIPEESKEGKSKTWSAYSPDTIIRHYGPPSHAAFGIDWGPNILFSMSFYYDDIHLIVEYVNENVLPRQKKPSLICPLSMNYEIVDVFIGENQVYVPPLKGLVQVTDATGMTIEEFSELMTEDKRNACFVINSEKF